MKYLLDTHAVIWYFENSEKLPKKITELIDDPKNIMCICAVSLWEIAIKMSLSKLELKLPFDEFLSNIKKSDFEILQIEDGYLKKLLELPFVHKDPFDRLIISTAIAEDLTIITIDDDVKKYDVSWIW